MTILSYAKPYYLLHCGEISVIDAQVMVIVRTGGNLARVLSGAGGVFVGGIVGGVPGMVVGGIIVAVGSDIFIKRAENLILQLLGVQYEY